MPDPVAVVVRHHGRDLSGTTLPGESWAAAAERVAGASSVDPTAVDLSGEVKRFDVTPDRVVTLRAMTLGDLDLVTRWRDGAAVRQWWQVGAEQTLEQIREMYAERIAGRSPTRMWIIEVNGRSVGFVQDYVLRDYPDYAVLTPDPEAVGVDYAIGADEWRGRGLGPAVLWSWMRQTRQLRPEAITYFSAPDHRNRASLRVLAKAGFAAGTWFDDPQSDGSVHTVVGCTLDVRRVLG
ncbi:acetyltransferase [Nocardioides KLBMP 9356]|uniref:Acetyltransferase n=1 Tax=Nocardioides potassii TaxID=2911371 RepID=A0ABS9HB81_9ACTN|nr:GNAT family N-acetyltransferase [Nocardioides potassii]MCF6377494.1 acetyltransferase [Nocardioides potassii]